MVEMYMTAQGKMCDRLLAGLISQARLFLVGIKGSARLEEGFTSRESWFSRYISSGLFFINGSLGREGCKKIPPSWAMDLLLKARVESLDPLSTMCDSTS